MRKLRTLVPLGALVLLVATSVSYAAPPLPTPYRGGFYGDAPHTANYEWISSTWAPEALDVNSAFVSDAAFFSRGDRDYYVMATYNAPVIYDVTDPATPILKSWYRCPGSQGDVIVHGNLLLKAHEGSHNIPNADLNRACETGAANETQRITLIGYDTDGKSFRLRYGGNNTVPITRGQNNTAAGVQAALQGGNEQQQVILTGFTTGSSYALQMGGQTSSVQLVGGTNHDATTIGQILLGRDEQQTVSFGGAFDPTTGDKFTVSIGGNTSAAIPAVDGNLTATEIEDAVNAISGFAGTVTASSVTNSGFTLTFGGASRKANVANVNIGFAACATSCTSGVNESVQGRAPLHSSLLDATVTVGTVSNAGYTLTFSGTLDQTDVLPLSVVNQASMTSGTVRENVKGTAGVAGWVAGGTVTVASLTDNGYTLTFAGNYAQVDVPAVTITNGTGSPAVTGSVRENVKGGAPLASWPSGGTATVSNVPDGNVPPGSINDYGFNVAFAGTLAGTNSALMSLQDLNGVTGVVERSATASPLNTGFQGVTIFDISDVSNPKFLKAVPACGGPHTFTKYFDKAKNRLVVYITRGSPGTAQAQYGLSCAGLSGARLSAVVVPVKNPKGAYLASENIPTGLGSGCHDVNVHQEAKLLGMACAGGGGASLADISDPLNPTLKWTFTWPGLATTHSAAISWDAKYIYINGEPGGGSGAECAFDDDVNKPTVHILDSQTSRVVGHWALPRPQSNIGVDNCTVHVVQMVPIVGRHLMATSFYIGGMALTDFTNPKAAREIGFMDIPTPPAGVPTADTSEGCWTGYVYNNYQYCTELDFGFHVWKVNEPWWENQLQLTEMNGQTNDAYIRCKVTQSGGPARARQMANATATLQLSIAGVAPWQTGKGVKVRFEAPGFSKEVLTGSDGQATVPVIASGAGKLRVSAPPQINLPYGCAAKVKPIKKALR
jgi:hypothetical protein